MSEIVVGADPTREGKAALIWALREGVLRKLPVIVVRAWLEPASVYPMMASAAILSQDWEASARELVQELVSGATAELTADERPEVRVVTEHGGAGLVLAQLSHGRELLVVGTRQANVVSRTLLGSTSHHVLHHVVCPVAVVPVPETLTGAAAGAPGRIIVGIDHSPASRAAMRWAADEASRRDAVLVPVLVHEPPGSDPRAGDPQLESVERRRLSDAVPAGATARVEPEVLTGHASTALRQLADPQDVIVVGSRGRGSAVGMLLGSTSTKVVAHARCPVVIVREDASG